MRPLNLRVEGFGPFLEPAELELADVQLFALTGPTGSGKTTLLDAITFALYRRTPRIAKGFSELVHPAAESAKVRLTFALGDAVYRVTREIRLKGASEHRLERMEGGGFRVLPESEKVAELDRAIVRLLGLDYGAFTRSILLPQGEFDRFLRGTPAERRELLSGLYGLETVRRMRERAEAHRQAAEARLAEIKGRLAALSQGEDLEALRDEAEAARKAIEAEGRALERKRRALEAQKALFDLGERLAEVERRLAALASRKDEMQAKRARLERAARAAALAPEAKRLAAEDARLGELKAKAGAAASALEAVLARLNALPEVDDARLLAVFEERQKAREQKDLAGWRERLGPPRGEGAAARFDPLVASRLLEAQKEVSHLAAEGEKLARDEAAIRDLEADLERIDGELKAVLAEGRAKAEALRAAEEAEQAQRDRLALAAYHALLKPGEPCPLCRQVVREVPPAPAGDEEHRRLLAKVEKLRAERERLLERYQQLTGEKKAKAAELEARRRALAEARARLDRARASLPDPERIEADLEAQRRGLWALLGEGDPAARFAELDAEYRRLKAAKEARAKLEAERGEKEKAALAAENALKEAERALAGRRAAFMEQLAAAGFKDEAELRAAALSAAERSAIEAELKAYDEARQAAEAERENLKDRLAGREVPSQKALSELEAEVAGLEARLAEARRRLGALEERIARLEEEAKLRRKLEKAIAEGTRELALWRQLADDLRANRFPDFLIEHYQRDLVARASEFLSALYHGRYRLLARGGDYLVQDTWTGGERPVRTLSGGESFLASLALALALSEQLGGGKLGALFLDEGFGSLDRETLEVVSEVLQSLPSEGRLVGVVTHIEELAERFADRVVVEKSPRGSRIRWAG